ncbi:pyridoxal 5'-phosphate synthase glutaminase subunit PdxT [Kitasatospora sp. NPDC096147]|uniref:pyridoxal 5'-phosphate synthase glutaminase subunit PdxT n=1 Tax=Kitasatospora sp. NPDC096147 TaxID=3364093 RepID=UPI003824AE6F
MSTPVIGVLALQGDVREHLIALASADAIAREVRRPEELAEVDALVIPGGESTTMSKLALLFGLMEPLRERVRAGMPVYGTCAGMIMLADKILDGRDDQETVGGIDMTVRRNAFGRQNESFESGIAFEGMEQPVHGVFIRAPWVEEVGAGVQVLAELPAADGPDSRIVAVRQGNLLATSFHPELTGDHRVHEYFVRMAEESVAAAAG